MSRDFTAADRLGAIRVWMDANGVDVLALGECDCGPAWLSDGPATGVAVIAAAKARIAQADPDFAARLIKPGGSFAALGIPANMLGGFEVAIARAGGEILDVPAATWAALDQVCKAR